MSDNVLVDPTGSFFTDSNNSIEQWKLDEEERNRTEALGLTDAAGEEMNPDSAEARQLARETPPPPTTDQGQAEGGESKMYKPEDLTEHPGYERLGLAKPYTEGERESPNDPRWREVYDTNKDGFVDSRDDYGRDWMSFGKKRTASDVAGERKHAYTSGTGTADTETNILEAKNAIAGTSLDLINGLITLPETTVRTFMGQGFGKEELFFDPLKSAGIENPWQGTTLGHAGRILGSFSFGGAGAFALLNRAKWFKNLDKIKYLKTGWKNKVIGNTLKGMLAETAFMKTSVYRQDETAFNALQDQLYALNPAWGDALNWIAVGEYDHPMVKEAKGLAEAAGIPGIFGALFLAGRTGIRSARLGNFRVSRARATGMTIGDAEEFLRMQRNLIEEAEINGKAQLDAEAVEQFELPLDIETTNKSRVRADKNRPIVDDWQGAHTSTNTPSRIYRQLDLLDDLPDGLGSVDNPISTRQAELAADSVEGMTEYLQNQVKTLLGEPYLQGLMNDINVNRLNFNRVFGSAFDRFQELVGRDATDMTAQEFWAPFTKDFEVGGIPKGRGTDSSAYKAWALENVVVQDLVNQALFKDLRTRARAAREINDIADIFSTDGPMKGIADRLIFGLTNVKRSRFLVSSELAQLSESGRAAAIAQRTAELHDETVDGVRLMMQFLKDSDSQELAQGILEVFSMSNRIRNFKDFDAWMRQKLLGGEFAGRSKEGVLMKELGGVMVNSILSGPKTPLRAIMGTTANAYLNEVTTLLGAGMRAGLGGDKALLHASAASTKAMFELIPDAWKIFKTNLDSYFSGDIATIKSRFSEYTRHDENWELLGEWTARNGTNGEQAAYQLANMARTANNNKLLTWSTRVMGATDETFRWLLSKARARKKALLTVMRDNPSMEITPKMLKKAEDIEFARLHDDAGNIDITKDAFLERNYREVTLTTELKGFSKGLDELMNRYPLTKPFFLFARTGINGLRLSVKNLPGVGAIVNESRDILSATAQTLKEGGLLKYGIENIDDLQSAKNMIIGRQAVGSMVVTGVAHKYLSGGLTGNGPADATMRKMWMDSGWTPRSIKLGNAWVSYDSFEPFNLIMANVADIGDNMNLMGPQFAEERLQLLVAALGKGASSKTYLQGVGQLFDLLSGDAGYSSQRIIANLVNNQMPLAGLRNSIAELISPNMRELDSDFRSHIANRNPFLKWTQPIRYDTLNGQPIRPWNFLEAAYNAVSPIGLRLDKGQGRQLLFKSNYDMRIFAYSAPDGTSLRDSPTARSLFQQAIGNTDIEFQLNRLASRPDVIASIKAMEEDIRRGNFALDPMKAYLHNRLIRQLFQSKTKEAWAAIRHNSTIKQLKNEQQKLTLNNRQRLVETQNLLSIPK